MFLPSGNFSCWILLWRYFFATLSGVFDLLCFSKYLSLSEMLTQWYCAPEILLAAPIYDESVDIWSVGCILAEMLRRRPLFVGVDHIGVLTGITSLIGKPTEQDLWFVTNPR